MIILGDEENEKQTVSIRARNGDQCNDIPLSKFIEDLAIEINSRSRELSLVIIEDWGR